MKRMLMFSVVILMVGCGGGGGARAAALALPGYAMPAEEVQALNDLARAPPELACRAWTHFNRNLLALPRADGAALARFALGPR